MWSDGQGDGGDVVCCGLLLGILLRVAWCCVMWGWWCCVAWCGVMMYEAREVLILMWYCVVFILNWLSSVVWCGVSVM